MALTIFNTFEGGTDSTALTAGSSGNTGGASGSFFNIITTNPGANVAFSNNHPSRTPLSAKFTTDATGELSFVAWSGQLGGSITQIFFRIYAFFPSLPSSTQTLFQPTVSAGGQCARLNLSSIGILTFTDAANTVQITATTPIATGKWIRIAGYVTGSATTGQLEFKLFNTADSQTADDTKTSVATLNTTGPIAVVRFGVCAVAVASALFFLDDLGVSDTGYLGPSLDAGTGSVSLKKISASGSGGAKLVLTGFVNLKKMGLSGSGKETDSAAGSISLKKPRFAGTGKVGATGSGSVQVKKMIVAGAKLTPVSVRLNGIWQSCTVKAMINGMWTPALPKVSVGGVWYPITDLPSGLFKANGSVALKKMRLAGSAKQTITGTGSVDLAKMSLSVFGSEEVSGFGSVKLKKMKLAGVSGTDTSLLFGCDSQNFPLYKATLPHVTVARVYAKETEGVAGIPITWPISSGQVASGAAVYIISFRPNDVVGFINGAYDGPTKSWLAKLPDNTALCVYHEGNLTTNYFRAVINGTADQFVAAHQKLQQLANQVNSTHTVGQVLFTSSVPNPNSPWITPGLDWYGLDIYGGKNTQTFAQASDVAFQNILNVVPDAVLAVIETNDSQDTVSAYNQFFLDGFNEAKARGMKFYMTWWGTDPTATPPSFNASGSYVSTLRSMANSL
ncbi:MAG TPA: hypothetical protein VGI71_23890 [Scandinavium sp.]|jgi:hypothetical protein